MAKYIIEGGHKLTGEIAVSGNKNSVLPCLAASLLTRDEVILENVPNISDVETEIQILKNLGAEVSFQNHIIKVHCREITGDNGSDTPVLHKKLAGKLRASILLVGPLLARVSKVEFPHPGGCIVGKRVISAHLSGLADLGYTLKPSNEGYRCSKSTKLHEDVTVFLEERSVTATENLIMASVLGEKTVIIKNCAEEPHIVDLCNLLNLMGAKISGIGSSTLVIPGTSRLHGAKFRIGCDYIELVTYAIAGVLTNGSVAFTNCSLDNLEPILLPLKKAGITFKEVDGKIRTAYRQLTAVPKLHTNVWPGFPTDLMSAFIVLATQSKGVSLLHDWMYESRMFFADKLISMGADITLADPHRVIVSGPTELRRKELESPDIRAGMALVLAALCAQGISTINKAELIERGYEEVVGNLSRLGAKIERVE